MEQKTIGEFIASLRKESGITQKQLAEKLNVSDKTISHWERGESSPDLSVIPLIADIFGVTCDELIRGEKSEALPETFE
ncbi:MAG: helix-turn-helix domain-containing protein, partial [Eubacterium sp.]|nr:helix-turn-helix domain-containing protein [Eubacterium sp.]